MAKAWKVTVRRGPKVSRERFDDLGDALAFAREQADRTRRTDRLPDINALRDIPSEQRVAARIGVSGKGLLRGPEAGLDVKGDGTLVAYSGSINKRDLGAEGLEDAIERMREALD